LVEAVSVTTALVAQKTFGQFAHFPGYLDGFTVLGCLVEKIKLLVQLRELLVNVPGHV
jgi:hypothetical protein